MQLQLNKLLIILSLVLMTTAMSAQQLYNGSFEQWSSPLQPDGWGTWAASVAQFNGALGDSLNRLTYRDSTTHANYSYPHDTVSVRLVVDTCTFPAQGQLTLAGFISYGGAFYVPPPDTAPGLYYGYYPYYKKPDSLIFDYKYVPAHGYYDSALVVMTMNRFDSARQTEVMYLYNSWLLDTTSAWTHISIPLVNYYAVHDTFAPDSIQLIILSSVASYLHQGTTLWLDSIHFDASVDIITDTTGIINIQDIKGIKAYPNPAGDRLNILVQPDEVGGGLQLFDAAGREVYSATISRQDFIINTECLPDGIYSLRVHSMDRITVYTGRVTVVHSR
jgi:hypothetical protein